MDRTRRERQDGEACEVRQSTDGEIVDEFLVAHTRWTVELRDYAQRGIEVQFLRDGQFSHSFRWPTRELALDWAKTERREIEKGRST